MWKGGKADPGYGEPPAQPRYNSLSNVLYCRVLDKVSSSKTRLKRAVLLSSEAVVVCEAGTFDVRRIVELEKVTKAILQSRPPDPRLEGPREGQALLLKVPMEHDLVLAQAKRRKAGYATQEDVVTLAQAIETCKLQKGQKFDIVHLGSSENLMGKAFLERLRSHATPTISTFAELNAYLSSHKPSPELLEKLPHTGCPATQPAPAPGPNPAVAEAAATPLPGEQLDEADAQDAAATAAAAADTSAGAAKSDWGSGMVKADGGPLGHRGSGMSAGEWSESEERSAAERQRMADAQQHRRTNPFYSMLFQQGAAAAAAATPVTQGAGDGGAAAAAATAASKSDFGCDLKSSLAEKKQRESGLQHTATPLHNSVHKGQWRGEFTKLKCSILGDLEGALCAHSGIIDGDHWSCCGATSYNTPFCTMQGWVGGVAAPSGAGEAPVCQVCTQVVLSRTDERVCPKCGCLACPTCCNPSYALRLFSGKPAASSSSPVKAAAEASSTGAVEAVCRVCFYEVQSAAPQLASAAAADAADNALRPLHCQICAETIERRARRSPQAPRRHRRRQLRRYKGVEGVAAPGEDEEDEDEGGVGGDSYLQCAQCGCTTCVPCGSYSLRLPTRPGDEAPVRAEDTFLLRRKGVVVGRGMPASHKGGDPRRTASGPVQVCKACFMETRGGQVARGYSWARVKTPAAGLAAGSAAASKEVAATTPVAAPADALRALQASKTFHPRFPEMLAKMHEETAAAAAVAAAAFAAASPSLSSETDSSSASASSSFSTTLSSSSSSWRTDGTPYSTAAHSPSPSFTTSSGTAFSHRRHHRRRRSRSRRQRPPPVPQPAASLGDPRPPSHPRLPHPGVPQGSFSTLCLDPTVSPTQPGAGAPWPMAAPSSAAAPADEAVPPPPPAVVDESPEEAHIMRTNPVYKRYVLLRRACVAAALVAVAGGYGKLLREAAEARAARRAARKAAKAAEAAANQYLAAQRAAAQPRPALASYLCSPESDALWEEVGMGRRGGGGSRARASLGTAGDGAGAAAKQGSGAGERPGDFWSNFMEEWSHVSNTY